MILISLLLKIKQIFKDQNNWIIQIICQSKASQIALDLKAVTSAKGILEFFRQQWKLEPQTLIVLPVEMNVFVKGSIKVIPMCINP